MKYFIPKRTYYLRVAEISILVIVIFLGLFVFKYCNLPLLGYNNKFNFTSNLKYSLRFSKKISSKSFEVKDSLLNAKSIPVLFYHGVLDTVAETDSTNISYNNFSDQMISLKENGWQTVRIDDFLLFTQGKKDLPEKSFLLTFDDGRKDSYYPVDPILKALNFNATIFIIGNSLGNSSETFYLNKKELEKMSMGENWEIQPHTYAGHNEIVISDTGEKGRFYSNKMWLESEKRVETDAEYATRVRNDFLLAKELVENIVKDKNVSFFAFPFGDYGQESFNFYNASSIIENEVNNIFSLSFYQDDGFNYSDNKTFIKRIGVNNKISKEELLKILNLGSEKDIPYTENIFLNIENWKNEWGTNEVINGKMIIKSSHKSTGGSSVLKGSKFWDNYYFKTTINWKKGSNVALLARYENDSNYLACNYSNDVLRIEKVIDGKKFIQERKIDFNFMKSNLELGVVIDGVNISCMLDNRNIFSTRIQHDELTRGGIGFKTWDKRINNSEIEVCEVNVGNN